MYNYGYNNGYVPYSQNQQPSYNAPNQAYNGFSAVPNGFNAQPNFAPQYPQNAPQQNAQPAPQMNTNKIYVTGIEDARNRTLAPNSDYIFLDNDKPLLYRKTVDATGKMEIHRTQHHGRRGKQEFSDFLPRLVRKRLYTGPGL